MKLQGTPFNSRIARRVFTSFLLAGVAPLLVIGTLSTLQLGNTLTERAQDELTQASRSQGQQIYERLLIGVEVMKEYGNRVGSAPTHDSTVTVLPPSRMFRATPPGLSAAELLAGNALLSNRAQVSLGPDADKGALTLRVRHGQTLLMAFLAPRYLWGDPAENPYGVDFCVFAVGVTDPLACPRPLPEAVQAAVARQPQAQGFLEWGSGDHAYMGAYRELFTNSAFDGPVLRILAVQPRVLATESLTGFNRTFPLVILLTVVLALLLAGWQIRRRLQPVEALLGGTQLFGEGDFGHRIELASQDEFGELAGSMNAMAARLGRQFDALKLLSDMDRMILAARHLDEIADLVLTQIPRLFRCRWASLMFVDSDSPRRGKLRVLPPGQTSVATSRVTLRDVDLELLAQLRGGTWLEAPDLMFNSHLLTEYQANRPTYVMPILHEDRIAGSIMLCSGDDDSPYNLDPAALRDIADRLAVAVSATEREAELYRRAYYDELTGLPNRQLCMDRLEQALAHARRTDEDVAVLFVDLDRFKVVNDSVGHSGGDEVLREAAQRLRRCVREIDTVARLGGDEFLVILPEMHGVNNVRLMAERILSELSKPFVLGSSEIFLSGSIGVAAFPGDGSSADELIRKADTAMYRAKESGRGRHVAFSDSMEAHIQRRIMLEADLRQALERSQISLHYQPQVCFATGQVIAAEALLRWKHPTEGNVSPTEFIGIAEDCGYIAALGCWALRQACTDVKKWRDAGLGVERVAVNVSARQLTQPEFVAEVTDAISATGIAPEWLELELTESVFVDDVKKAASVLRQLKALGVRISIDDFGTGYSALSYLKELSFDTVKVDRSFVFDLPVDQDAAAITNAIVAMAHTLGKTVVAEGVMSGQQYEFLRSVGIDLGQGALFSMPMPAAALEDYVTASAQHGGAVQATVA